jgi:NADPH2:quinone reductase
MRAAVITEYGGPEVLEVREVPTPDPVAEQVRVRVRASALNRADLLQRRGQYPAPPGAPQNIPGLEFAGEVDAVGPTVTQWKPGQRVFGICGGGGHAEYVVVPERTLAEIPGNLDWRSAGAIPEAFITAHDGLWIQAALRPGERVLVNAVGSGVGLAAVQLIKTIGAEAYGTARTGSKLGRAREYGMLDGWQVESGSDLARVAAKQKFDVVLELAGGDYVASDLEVLAPRGRLILVGTMAGGQANVNLGLLLAKRLRILGTVLRSRPIEEKIQATQAFAREVVPLLARGVLKPAIDCEFDLDAIRDAHRYMEANSSAGKIVLHI